MEDKKIVLDLNNQFEEFKKYKKLRNNLIKEFLFEFTLDVVKFSFFVWFCKKFGVL